jgi:hypothetical protein
VAFLLSGYSRGFDASLTGVRYHRRTKPQLYPPLGHT